MAVWRDKQRRDKLMNQQLNYLPVQSQPRQEPEQEPTLADLCDRFEATVFFYWLLGLCSQGAIIWLLVKMAQVM